MHRTLSRRTRALAVLLAAGWGIPAPGFERGAFSGLSGSPESIGMSGSAGSCVACHDFVQGPGSVRLIGVPANYSPSAVYDIVVWIQDASRSSAGFELSVENGPVTAPLHQSFLSPVDSFTDFASNDPNYLAQTRAGAQNATANWAANGNVAKYYFRWQAPSTPAGLIRFFVAVIYQSHCDACHGPDGMRINFGTTGEPEYVGKVAVDNPWEFMHKVRVGHPGASMPALVDLFTPIQRAADLGAQAQTFPTQ